MTADIFAFWSQIQRGETVHPADHDVFDRMDATRHGFRRDCLPAAFGGRLRTAPVVLLFLSPGFSEKDVADANTDAGKDYYLRRWQGNEPFRDGSHQGAQWLMSRTKRFGAWPAVRERIAVLNIGAYHSEVVESLSSLVALPSSRVSLDWAQKVLFPDAEAGRRVVICMRSAMYWGLETGRSYGQCLFAPQVTRGGHIQKTPLGEQAVAAARQILG